MTDYTPTTNEMREWYVRRDRTGRSSRKEYELEFDRWLTRELMKAKVGALREVAGALDVPGAVNFGDGGVFVRVDFCDPNKDVPLAQWLRDRANELERATND